MLTANFESYIIICISPEFAKVSMDLKVKRFLACFYIYIKTRLFIIARPTILSIILGVILTGNINAEENLFEALPHTNRELSKQALLGKRLFHDPILSKDNTLSCATCHPLLNYGVDGLKKSIGFNKAKGKRNAPTVWNARYNFAQFWDGRAGTLQEQAQFSITSPREMNESLESVVRKLKQDKSYNNQFKLAYSNGVTKENLLDAIAEFEKTLITVDSKFDLYLKGDKNALSKDEKEGLMLFKAKGCVACHNGINVGGTLFQKIGVFKDFDTSGDVDYGRYEITKKSFDRFSFKVPGLRNVEMTAPYFHDGSVATLKEAVQMMVELQLGREVDEEEVNKIILFLKTLTGKTYE